MWVVISTVESMKGFHCAIIIVRECEILSFVERWPYPRGFVLKGGLS